MRNRLLVFVAVMATAVGHSYASCTASSPYVCTGGGITIPATNQNGDLESSAQTISGLAGSISKITVAVNNWNDPAGTAPNLAPGHQDREFMLVFQPTSGPAQSFEFLAGLGSDNNSISNLSITLDDSASGYAPDHNEDVTGHPANGVSYKPTVNNPNVYCAVQNSNAALAGALVTLPACAPDNPSGPDESSGGTATFASQFSGSPNGTWTLYVWTNKQGVDSPATIDSWTLTITTQPNPANTTTTLASDAANNETTIGTTVTLTATVSSTSMVNEGAFTFTDNGTNLNCASGNPAVIAGNVAPCTTSFASEGSHALLAVYSEGPDFATSQGPMNLFVDNPTIATPGQPGQYCNPGVITLNSTSQTGASPYPQHITIPTQTGSLTDVSLLLHNINLPNGALHDLNVLLVDPHGNKFIPLAGTGGFNAISGLDLTLSDYGSGPLPDPLSGGSAITSGSYLPTDNNAGLSFPTGTPSGSYSQPQNQGGATFDTTFGGIDASGQWSLYVYDTLGNDIGTIAGYCLNITTTSAPATSTNLTASPSGSALVGQNVTFTATVTVNASGAPVNGGTVTLKEHGAILSGPSPVSSTGQVTFATSSLSEGIHTITALYSGVAGSYNVSSGSISIEVDTATSQTGNQYCNAGGINILATSSGQNTPANPYPSRINVTSLAGTVNSLTISLNNFSNSDPSGIAMLLQGPSATNIVFWNYAGGDNGIGPLNLTLADGSALIAAPPVDAASYAPTSNTLEPTPVFASPAPVNLSFAAPQASQTFTAAFQNINPNGYWDLYVYDRLGSQNLSIGQWCLTFNENAPILAITMSHSGSFTQGDTADIYTIQVTNDGPGSSAGTLSLVDTLPAGMTASAMSQTGGGTGSDWTCAAGTASCTRTTAMPAGETDIISLTVIVGSSTATGVNAVTNSVTVSGGGISQAQTANALTTINPSTVTVTVSTNVSGPMIQVDGGAAYTGSHQFTWSVNQAHSLTTSSPQGTGATVYTFTGWSDGTAATTDSITPPATVASYTAMFSTTYTTTVSASTSPITYSSSAQNVILSATVSSPSTLNTGTVTFTVMSNGTPIGPPVTSAPVTNGATSATFTVPANTAAGSYTIQAQYSGASSALVTYSSSSDTSHVLTVNAASQTITFATPAAVTYASGLTVNLAGDATASSGLPVAYTLQSGGTGIGTLTGTTLTVTEAGTFIIQASQPGNANYSAATPVQATLVVNAATQTITFATPPAVTYTSGLTVNLTGDATASSGLPVTYTLQSGGTGQGGITGTTLTVTQAGAFVIQASQPGNANYSAATPVQATLVVNAATQTITFSIPPPATYTTGLTVNLAGAATATSSLPVTYTLQSGGTGIGSLIGTTLTVTQAGTLVIQASQSGNANYSAATPVQATLVVNATSQTITFSTPQALTYASGLTVNLAGDATASSGLPVTYTLQTGGTGLGSIAGATLTVTQAGTFVIQASQSGNANYSAAAPAQATLVVNAASQTITFATPPAVTFTSGLTVNLAGDATPSSGLAVTYTLQAGGTGLGSITGTTLTVTQAGTFVIQASQPGNANYSAATPAQATLVVNRGIQVITFSNPGPQSYGTGPLALSATVNSGLIVNFVSNTTPVCTVAGSTLTIVSVGLCSITASVAANVDYLAASNVAQAFQIQPAPQTIAFSTLGNQVVPGFPLALSASASSGLPVSVSSLTPSVCTVTSALPVRAKVLAAGTCSLQATQPGNALYAPATAVQSLTVASHR